MKDLTTEMWPIEELKEWDKNPRKPTKTGIENLKKQITDLGQYKPMLINTNPKVAPIGSVAGGNMRLKALRELGTPKVWVIPIAFKNEAEMIKVALSDNDRAGVYVEDQLVELVQGMTGIDLQIYSIDLKEPPSLDIIVSNHVHVKPEDEFTPEPPKTPKSKYGQIYELGRHRIMCGDATKEKDVAALMNGKLANIVWVKNSMILSRQDFHRCYEPCIYGWKKGKTHWKNKELLSFKDVFSSFQIKEEAQKEWMLQRIDQWVEAHMETNAKEFDVWFQKRDSVIKYLHPTQKPVALAEQAIKKNSVPGGAVLDLFAGSFSTLIAAEKLGRSFYGMDMDPIFVDVGIKRWEDYTGYKAKLLKRR